MLEIHSQPGACGALVSGVDLAQTLEPLQVQAIRNAWLDHQVLGFPDQHLDLDALERLALALGDFGEDPFLSRYRGILMLLKSVEMPMKLRRYLLRAGTRTGVFA